jgi:hypothetical protein
MYYRSFEASEKHQAAHHRSTWISGLGGHFAILSAHLQSRIDWGLLYTERTIGLNIVPYIPNSLTEQERLYTNNCEKHAKAHILIYIAHSLGKLQLVA